LRFGHHDDGFIAQRIGHQRQADARVARGAFHDGAARLHAAALFGIAHDPQRRASFTDWPGLANSHLPQISQPAASEGPWSSTSGVLPMRSSEDV
jgi:hypothetical protein